MRTASARRVALATKDEGLAQRFGSEIGSVDVLSTCEAVSNAITKRSHVVLVADAAAELGSAWHRMASLSLGCNTPLLLMDLRGDSDDLPQTWYPRRDLPRLMAHALSLIPAAVANEIEHKIVGDAEEIRLLRQQIENVARFRDVSVLTLGETGTGKELVAECIHALSGPPTSPFVAVNCAAIPEQLFESELFGHEAGAYTGARGARQGLLEAASGGTMFLDEVGEMPQFLQTKLLRALESRSFRRVGSNRDIPLNARIVSATNQTSGGERGLRPDLYYRLAGFTLMLPPLRERPQDIDALAQRFLWAFRARHPSVNATSFTRHALDALHAHSWPGNVRELRAVVEHAVILSRSTELTSGDIANALRHQSKETPVATAPASATRLPDVERDMIAKAFAAHGQNVSKAARSLGIPRTTLRARLRRYGLTD